MQFSLLFLNNEALLIIIKESCFSATICSKVFHLAWTMHPDFFKIEGWFLWAEEWAIYDLESNWQLNIVFRNSHINTLPKNLKDWTQS